MNLKEKALALRAQIETMAADLPDATALDVPELFPRWEAGKEYSAGFRICYQSKLYRCVQAHTSQADWTPDRTPALWTEVSVDEWPEWRQPTGTQDAYNKGDKVSYNGQHYISLIDGNVWNPADYPAGWEAQE